MNYILLIAAGIMLAGCGLSKDGAPGQQGPSGLTGSRGLTGAQGEQGTAGVDPTPTYLVQLCPGDTVYAWTYPEYGLCVDHTLYAIYSSVSTLVKLTEGVYNSNSIGNSCTFTVTADCGVTNWSL